MILINKEIDSKIINHPQLLRVVGEVLTIKMFHSEKYDRDYNVFKVEGSKSSVILKKVNRKNEILINNYVSDLKLDYVPKIEFIIRLDDENWICMSYLESDDIKLVYEDMAELIKNLSHYHLSYDGFENKQSLEIEMEKWKPREDELLMSLINDSISEEDIRTVIYAEKLMDDSLKTIIHGDLILLNVIKSRSDIFIIDWEYGEYAPLILDLGRLLGDMTLEDVRRVDEKWESDLLDVYYSELVKHHDMFTKNSFLELFECAKLHNYMGVILNYKRNKTEFDNWYNLNLREMKKCIKEINQYN